MRDPTASRLRMLALQTLHAAASVRGTLFSGPQDCFHRMPDSAATSGPLLLKSNALFNHRHILIAMIVQVLFTGQQGDFYLMQDPLAAATGSPPPTAGSPRPASPPLLGTSPGEWDLHLFGYTRSLSICLALTQKPACVLSRDSAIRLDEVLGSALLWCRHTRLKTDCILLLPKPGN